MESNFARFPRWAALFLLVALAALIAYGVAAPPFPLPPVATGADSSKSDVALYRAVLRRAEGGEDFYQATAVEQRTRGYPLRPFVTVRPPWFTHFVVAVGGVTTAKLVFQALVVSAGVLFALRLIVLVPSRAIALAAALGALTFLFVASVPIFYFEAWSAALVLLSLACWSRRTWGLSLALGLIAALLRELVAPFLLVMLAMALWERRRAEATAWLAAIGVFASALWVHAAKVHAVTTLADKASPGWVGSGGWSYIIRMVHEHSALVILPLWIAAVVLPLTLLGWASWRHPLAHRATLYLGGFIATFLLIGRRNTAYWGMLLTSLLLIGVAFAPSAILTLSRRVRRVA